MIGLGCTAFLIVATLLAMDLKFGWTRKKGGGRLKPIVNAIQSLTVLIMFPSKVRRGYEEREPHLLCSDLGVYAQRMPS